MRAASTANPVMKLPLSAIAPKAIIRWIEAS